MTQCLKARIIRLASDPGVGYYRRDVAVRRNVESQVNYIDALGRNSLAPEVRYFRFGPQLDRYLFARVETEIYARQRRRYIEGDIILMRGQRYHVGPNLVGNISIGSYSVRSYDDAINLA